MAKSNMLQEEIQFVAFGGVFFVHPDRNSLSNVFQWIYGFFI